MCFIAAEMIAVMVMRGAALLSFSAQGAWASREAVFVFVYHKHGGILGLKSVSSVI
jgi:hypothetical protein